jgi:hypothetical protein
MTVLVLTLWLSVVFGGRVDATLTFETMEACKRFVLNLEKFTVKHTIWEPCHADNLRRDE